ncbi:DNA-directed RNA polymerase subunit omega [Bacillus sp. REN16]|uniref:DNA-directed RNA polymerase subunit omega n=1 Tax=Bacillus sp. REN16 TaxID=2887296 RepID=UPI001E3A723D|nr:DNA-directed RNA polymerase subunit omega [Bacillus sp. REN16]MCC3357526.1 DNA-directed RNA polymerase subunit omega [Bacillus sp. REN16]
MLDPSIDSLLNKLNSKYTLVTVAAKRARVMQERNDGMVQKPVSFKSVGKALEEIDAGLLYYSIDKKAAIDTAYKTNE